MSYFAILKSAEHDQIEVDGCHINLWLIRDANDARTYFDVGLSIPGCIRRAKFRLALPLTTQSNSPNSEGCRSLHVETRSLETATRIWGEHVATSKTFHNTIEIGRANTRTLYVAEASVSKDSTLSTDAGEVWNVSFVRPVPDASNPDDSISSYVRLRFQASSARTLIQEIDGGVIVDFRIADIRNVGANHAWSGLAASLVALPGAQIFIVAPSVQRLVAHDPPFKNMRVLESEVWSDYLKPQPRNKMTVFYWKRGGELIAEDSPFRGYISLEQAQRSTNQNTASLSIALQSSAGVTVGIAVGVVTYFFLTLSLACVSPLWSWLKSDPVELKAIGGLQLLGGLVITVLTILGISMKRKLRQCLVALLQDKQSGK